MICSIQLLDFIGFPLQNIFQSFNYSVAHQVSNVRAISGLNAIDAEHVLVDAVIKEDKFGVIKLDVTHILTRLEVPCGVVFCPLHYIPFANKQTIMPTAAIFATTE
jgi:hypothetical protein